MKQIQPDIIICDVMMPQMDGFTFLHTIKQNLSAHSRDFTDG
ncbi:response regulator [Larkinella humicola]|uniref:Response regulator n=1 Tax=Larkinella humicola TaxID=2607654 RepID=A0A5N1J3D7_9BACT|nr:response regulator [Larkinella humicola]